MNPDNSKRFLWIDYAKFIGIFLVVFGHTAIPRTLYEAIFSFHIPLFFFISGYLFNFAKYDSYKSFLHKRARQLLAPYFFFNIITYIFWFFIGRRFGNDSTRDIKLYTPIIGIFSGNGSGDYLVHNIASWFLACLFTVENLFFLFFRRASKNKKWILVVAFFIAGYFDSTYDPIRFPWGLNVALIGLVFYASGNLFKEELNKFLQKGLPFLIPVLLIAFAFYVYLQPINSEVNLNDNKYHNYWSFWPTAFAGIFVVLILSRILEYEFSRTLFVEYIARNTIIILVFQFIALSVIKGFTLYILKTPLAIFDNGITINLFISSLVISMLVPLMYIVENYFPFLLGKPSKSLI